MKSWEDVPRRYRASYKPCPVCGGAMARHARQCRSCSEYIPREAAHYAWKGDAARDTTKRSRIQSRLSLEGVTCERCATAPATDRHHIDGDTGHNARANLALLCRRCHMIVDGRLERFVSAPRRAPQPPKPCAECHRPYKPLSRGLCHTCYERQRRRAAASR